MTDVYATDLEGMPITSSEGTQIGHLESITANIKTGDLNDLVITPTSQEAIGDFGKGEGGDTLRIPIEQIKAINDHIVVSKEYIGNVKENLIVE